MDEFDSIGKLRDYNQDHGEMKRVVNTILQLMDYLPQKSLVICATNQIDMIDDALKRRFDMNLKFEKPNEKEIQELIKLTLKSGKFYFDTPRSQIALIKSAIGLSASILINEAGSSSKLVMAKSYVNCSCSSSFGM